MSEETVTVGISGVRVGIILNGRTRSQTSAEHTLCSERHYIGLLRTFLLLVLKSMLLDMLHVGRFWLPTLAAGSSVT